MKIFNSILGVLFVSVSLWVPLGEEDIIKTSQSGVTHADKFEFNHFENIPEQDDCIHHAPVKL